MKPIKFKSLGFKLLLFACLLVSGCSSTNTVLEFESSSELEGIVLPISAKKIDHSPGEYLYHIETEHESFYKLYIDKLADEGWTVEEENLGKTYIISKANKKYVLMINKTADEEITVIGFRELK